MLQFIRFHEDTGKTVSENPLAAVVVAQALPVTNGAEPGSASLPGSTNTAASAEKTGASAPGSAPAGGPLDRMGGEFSALLTDLEALPEPSGIPSTGLLTESVSLQRAAQNSLEPGGRFLPPGGELLPGTGHRLPVVESPLSGGDEPGGELADLSNNQSVPAEASEPRLPPGLGMDFDGIPHNGFPNNSAIDPTGRLIAPATAQMTSVANSSPLPVEPQPAVVAGPAARATSVSAGSVTGDVPQLPPGNSTGPLAAYADGQAGDLAGDNDGEQPLPQPRGERAPAVAAQISGPSIRLDHAEPAAILLNPLESARPGTPSLNQTIELNLRAEKSGWLEPLAQRLAVMAGKGANTAEVQLSPPHLGRLEIRIAVHNDQASVWLASANPEVREVLQQAMPRLDGLLEELGINLADSGVTEESLEQFSRETEADFGEAQESPAELTPEPSPAKSGPLSILDAWA